MNRRIVLLLIPFLMLPAAAPAQKKKKKNTAEDGLYPSVVLEDKKQKPEITQTLPPPRELPSAVSGETSRLIFQISPLSGRGLLSQQTRDALHALQRSAHGATILKLRAFVAGSGDMRRIGDLIGELWTDKRTPLPALSVVQTGGLPMEGAQVVIESIAEEHRIVNTNGVAFLAGQQAGSVAESLSKLSGALKQAGMDDSDMLHVTCFVRWLDENKDAQHILSQRFPSASVNYVQMQREYIATAAECEGVARAREAASPVKYMMPAAGYSQVVIVSAPKVVFSSTQLAFGQQPGDIRLAFERLQKSIAPLNARLDTVAMSHIYVVSRGLTDTLRTVRSEFYNKTSPPASTMLPIESLPSLDASLGVDVVAVADR